MTATKRKNPWWYVLLAPSVRALSFVAVDRLPADRPVLGLLVMAVVVVAALGVGELILRAARARR